MPHCPHCKAELNLGELQLQEIYRLFGSPVEGIGLKIDPGYGVPRSQGPNTQGSLQFETGIPPVI